MRSWLDNLYAQHTQEDAVCEWTWTFCCETTCPCHSKIVLKGGVKKFLKKEEKMWVIDGSLKSQNKKSNINVYNTLFLHHKVPFASQFHVAMQLWTQFECQHDSCFLVWNNKLSELRVSFCFGCFFKQVSAMICVFAGWWSLFCANPNVKVQNLTFAITNECVKFCLERISKSTFFFGKNRGSTHH